MRKIALILMLSLTMMVMVACGRTSSSTNRSTSSMTSSLSSTQQIRDDAALNAERLTLKQTAALVLYYRDAHMPGAIIMEQQLRFMIKVQCHGERDPLLRLILKAPKFYT